MNESILRALIVEDNDNDAELLVNTLREGGYDLVFERVQTAEAMRAALAGKDWDVIFCDYVMPGFDAPGALGVLQDSGREIPFIIVSGTIGEEVAVEALKRGANDYLLKQNLTRLVPALERALKTGEDRRSRQAVEWMNRLILANSPDVICTVDENYRFVEVSAASARVLGYHPSELIGRRLTDFLHPDDVGRTERDGAAIMGGDIRLDVENRYLRKDGSVVHMLWSSYWSPNDRLLFTVGRDITARKAAEAKLEQERLLFRMVIDNLPDLVYAKDREGRKTLSNPADLRYIGCRSEDEVLGRTDLEVFPEEIAVQFSADDQAVIQTGQPVVDREEPARVDQDGKPRWLLTTKLPLRDESGAVVGLVGIGRDITEQKRMLEAVRRSEERYQLAAQAADTGIWEWNIPAGEVYFSPELQNLLGYQEGGFPYTTENCYDMVHPDDRWQVEAATQAHLADRVPFDLEYRILTRSGEYRWFSGRAQALWDAGGNPVRMAGSINDVTDRKLARQRLLEQAALLDKAQDAIFVMDLEGRVHFWNRSAEQILGWTSAEVSGRNTRGFLEKDPARFDELWKELLQKGEWSGELVKLTKDGRELVFNTRWTLVRDDRGQPQSVLSLNTDITERQRLEQQFLRAQRMESIGALAGGIAHDLNNVLAPIVLSVELLKEKVSDPEDQSILQTLAVSARRGADMVRQILSFARGVEGNRVQVNPRHLIIDIEKILNDTFLKSIQVKTEIQRDVWTMLGDPTQLHQVLLNLGVNARDAMPAGGVLTISAENVVLDDTYAAMGPEATPGPHVLLRVSDTGTGIPAEIRDRIFDPFFTTKELGKGTGLGLATVHAIVKSHNGFITVYSEDGRGTTFKVYLPAQPSGHTETIRRESSRLPRGQGETVLIVDDEASVREITRHTLEAFGYRTMTARDGTEAVALFAQHRSEIAVVLTDMMMPLMDGAATIRALKAMQPDIKTIAASGLGTDGQSHLAARAGATLFLAKPYTAETLLESLRNVLHPGGAAG